MKMKEFAQRLASSAPVPGGGGASAAVGAFAAALGTMVANLTIGKERYADVEEQMVELREGLEKRMEELILLCEQDALAFEPLSKAYRLPKHTEEEKKHRDEVMEEALEGASLVPLRIMESILESMKLDREVARKGSRLAISDAGASALLADAALEAAALNIFINAGMMSKRERAKELEERAKELIGESACLKRQIMEIVMKKIENS
ncbi:MAG: cyclodeaminase/cyclohydrolase family protein [Johnsonella sp.]|nr:cyclodeaminase/cyclohydrolase family protein [Johnsonella sp.]